MQVIGQVTIVMTANGQVQCQYQGPGEDAFRQMMKIAHDTIIADLQKQKVNEPMLQIAPPDMKVELNPKAYS